MGDTFIDKIYRGDAPEDVAALYAAWAATYETDARIEQTEKRFEQLRQLAPGFQAIHPIRPYFILRWT